MKIDVLEKGKKEGISDEKCKSQLAHTILTTNMADRIESFQLVMTFFLYLKTNRKTYIETN